MEVGIKSYPALLFFGDLAVSLWNEHTFHFVINIIVEQAVFICE